MSDQEKQLAVEERKAAAMEKIAEALSEVAEAILQHDIGQQRAIVPALENIAGAITNKD